MRALLTTTIGQCQVQTLKTELAIACHYKAVMRFITSLNAEILHHTQIGQNAYTEYARTIYIYI